MWRVRKGEREVFDAIIYVNLSNQMIKEASSFQVCEDQPCTFNNTIRKKKCQCQCYPLGGADGWWV